MDKNRVDFKSETVKILTEGHYIIISAEAGPYPVGGALAAALAEGYTSADAMTAVFGDTGLGFAHALWNGRPALVLRVHDAAPVEIEGFVVEAAREHGHAAIIHAHGGMFSYWHVNGPLADTDTMVGQVGFGPDAEGFIYGPSENPPAEGTPNVVEVNLPGDEVLYFAPRLEGEPSTPAGAVLN